MENNRQVKDSLFSSLFYTCDDAEENAKALYQALTGREVHTAKKCRLEDVFFDQMRNDVSYEFDERIVFFVEHQSTINHNMPFRLLMYVGRIYEILSNRDTTKKFRRKLFKIPTPEFYVLYNGDEPLDMTELKLSDAFQTPTDVLELKVKVVDINLSALKESGLDKCRPLYEYSQVIDKIKTLGTVQAIKYCIDNKIIEDYIKQFGSEAFNMLFQSYDSEQDKKIYGEECLEEGIEQGIKQGIEQGIKQGVEQGIKQGVEQGIKQGVEQGIKQGVEQGIKQGVEQGVERERRSTLESIRNLLGLGSKLEDLIKIFHLNDEEIKFVTAI